MTGWSNVPFESLYSEPSRNGIYKTAEHHGSGAKIVNMGELFAHEFVGPQEMARVAMSDVELGKAGLIDGDLLFGRRSLVESGAGKCSLVNGIQEPTTFESSIIRVRLDSARAIPRFYYYWFRSRQGRGTVQAIVSGTNVKGIRGSNLKKLVVPSPTQEVQESIVARLRAYDDLIENNRRRIRLLEDAARLLYREWFVRLRFPGHEHVRVVDGVPQEWQKTTIGDVAETIGGGTPSTSIPAYWDDGDVTWFTPTDLTRSASLALIGSAKKITLEGLKHSSAKLLPPHTILMSSRASIGYFGTYDEPACTNQGFISMIPHDERYRYYLLHNLIGRKDEIISHAGGTTYKEINKTTFRALPIVLPSPESAADFNRFASDIMNEVRVLARQNEKLAAARDLLLPRLMSGELVP